MPMFALVAAALLAAVGTLIFSTLTYALRESTRGRLLGYADRVGLPTARIGAVAERRDDHIFSTAVGRFICNILLLASILGIAQRLNLDPWLQALVAIVATIGIGLVLSVVLPDAMARHYGHGVVVRSIGMLDVLRLTMSPAIRLMNLTDRIVAKTGGTSSHQHEAEQIDQEILSAVEEGQKEGLVNEQERTMIESVIKFRDTTAAQIMTPRPQIIGIDASSTLAQVKKTLEESGHSRIPVYRGTLDQIVGVLYARDLLKHLGLPAETFDLRNALRQTLYVPETKPLSDLLQEFRAQKVHIAIVLDEYGGTSGLITIEDLLEELVGDISDEHEPAMPALLKRSADGAWEADASVYLDDINRTVGLNLPEDAGYETLGGFVSTTLGRIPQPGTSFEHQLVRYTILEAEPQRVIRVRVESLRQPTPA